MGDINGSGLPPLNFDGFVAQAPKDKLFLRNVVPKSGDFEVADMIGQTINIGYGIKSLNPDIINRALEEEKVVIKQVDFTQYVDCTLIGELDENHNIPCWKVSNKYLNKKVYPKSSDSNDSERGRVGNNLELYHQQLIVLEKTISNFSNLTAFSGGFASPVTSINMADYIIYLGIDENAEENLDYITPTVFPLVRFAKTQFSKKKLTTVPLYETATCFNVPWNRFNKIGIPDVLVSVGQIINNPKVEGENGVGYVSSIDSSNPDVCAVLKQCSFSPLKSNVVSLLFTVYVDPFVENTLVKDDKLVNVPHLLELNFLTTFYFNYDKSCKDDSDDTLYNPSQVVPQPIHTGNSLFQKAFGL